MGQEQGKVGQEISRWDRKWVLLAAITCPRGAILEHFQPVLTKGIITKKNANNKQIILSDMMSFSMEDPFEGFLSASQRLKFSIFLFKRQRHSLIFLAFGPW